MIGEFGLENAFEGEYKLPESMSVKHTNAKTGLILFWFFNFYQGKHDE